MNTRKPTNATTPSEMVAIKMINRLKSADFSSPTLKSVQIPTQNRLWSNFWHEKARFGLTLRVQKVTRCG